MRLLLASFLLMVACKPGEDSAPAASQDTPAATAVAAAPSESAEPAAVMDAAPTQEGQSFLEGMEALCKSLDAVPANPDPAEYQKQVAQWIDDNVTNAKVRELFTIIGEMPAAQRPGMLKAASAKAGLQNCALAER